MNIWHLPRDLDWFLLLTWKLLEMVGQFVEVYTFIGSPLSSDKTLSLPETMIKKFKLLFSFNIVSRR